MRKIIIFLLVFGVFACFSVGNEAKAALVTVDPEWGIKVNVLAYQSDQKYEVTKVADNLSEVKNSRLSLSKSGDQVQMKLNGEDVNWDSKVYPTEKEVVEIERSKQPDNIKIYAVSEGFSIEQMGYVAKTELPIVIDSKNKSLALETQKGVEYLLFLPADVVATLLQSGTISEAKKEIVLEQDSEGGVYYQVEGNRNINVLKLVNIKVDVKAKLDAGTGRILSVDQPVWLSLFGFMLS